MSDLEFDDWQAASLDGAWEFYPGDHALEDLDRFSPLPIVVPGLWEAQGYLDLDGTAWYRRRFTIDDASGGWTLRFGAVMDFAEVFLNGVRVGAHYQAFTPFDLDVARALRIGENDLAVKVVDPSLADPDHLRMAHGKQGWANNVFPSRPSLYMTYGGIWQPVTLRRHGPIVIEGVFVGADPDDLVITAHIHNRGEAVPARVGFRTLGIAEEQTIDIPADARLPVEIRLGATSAAWWRPESPHLHELSVDVWSSGGLSDSRVARYGLRTIAVDGPRFLLNGEPYRMKGALVQGFRADTLYAEGSRADIEQEVRAALAMGFNTLRLHIKAFDPTYLDVCDELGMLLYCDIPIAAPIADEEIGTGTVLDQRCVAAAREQVRRDRNHPSIILWSAMNEIDVPRGDPVSWPRYQSFVRAVVGAIREEDPTRPIIENDWAETVAESVCGSPILSAHWYGQLHHDYLDKIERAAACRDDANEPFLVSEYGDWGLPSMPIVADPPFWDTRAIHAEALAQTLWPASISRFAWETQRYQGLADRLQAEVFRRHDHITGHCLTELTDVPFELNGLLDLHRRPKPLAVANVARGNQVVLPMLRLDSLVIAAGDSVRAPLVIANDGRPVSNVTVQARFGDSVSAVAMDGLLRVDASDVLAGRVEDRFGEFASEVSIGDLPGFAVVPGGEVVIPAPAVEGNHDLVVRLRAGDVHISENRYPIRVVRRIEAALRARVVGTGLGGAALREIGVVAGDSGPVVVTEGGLDETVADQLRGALADGEIVLVLAQSPEAAAHYPIPTQLEPLETAWGSTLFRFTTDHGALPALPRRDLLVGEDSTVHARTVIASVDGRPFPDTPVVIAYKPVPGALTGTVIGSHAVGDGRLVYCQYRLARSAGLGDAAARAILADLVRWVAHPRPVMEKRQLATPDGRALISYCWRQVPAR